MIESRGLARIFRIRAAVEAVRGVDFRAHEGEILLPMSLAPRWLRALSRANPFSHVVEGARAAVRGDFSASAIVAGLVAATALAVAGMAVGTPFQRESA